MTRRGTVENKRKKRAEQKNVAAQHKEPAKRRVRQGAPKQAFPSKPVRLSVHLLEEAERQATLEHRSVPRQIELWVEIGRAVYSGASRNDIYALLAGTATVKVEERPSVVVGVDDVLEKLESMRTEGSLSALATGGGVIYDAAPGSEGLIRRTMPDGSREIGVFKNGRFVTRESIKLPS